MNLKLIIYFKMKAARFYLRVWDYHSVKSEWCQAFSFVLSAASINYSASATHTAHRKKAVEDKDISTALTARAKISIGPDPVKSNSVQS